MIAVDAAHWPQPFGWGYVNLTGNLTASAIAFVAGYLVGRGPVKRILAEHRAHQKWMAEHLAEVHRHTTGHAPSPHPKHGVV